MDSRKIIQLLKKDGWEIMSFPENRSAIAFLVQVPSSHSVRINITLPEDILNIIDRRARRLHLSCSAFLAEAL
jgi:hypothetical protein